MEVDRSQVRGLGLFLFVVIGLAAGFAALIISAFPDVDALAGVMPLIVVYGVLMVTLWVLFALYFVIRARFDRNR